MSDPAIAAYLAELPPQRAQRARLLHRLIIERFPQAALSFKYRMPTYQVGEHFLAWASRKRHFTIYTCSAQRLAGFCALRPGIARGVGCINLRDRDAVDEAALTKLIGDALAPSAAILAGEREAAAIARPAKHK